MLTNTYNFDWKKKKLVNVALNLIEKIRTKYTKINFLIYLFQDNIKFYKKILIQTNPGNRIETNICNAFWKRCNLQYNF